jgi:glucosyl-dolichyl phosphate glucuronosyltransferase
VAICTLNRAESLRRTLESLAGMRIPGDLDWELVVVDNGSTDHTAEIVKSFADRLPLRREFEAQRGLSRARNRAIDVAKGDYFLWTDDDVVVGTGWLANYAEAFQRWPEAAVFGGPIIPRYEPPIAGWISECEPLIGGAFAIRNFGDQPLRLNVAEGVEPYGANFAVRGAEQRAFRYNPDLGVRPGSRRIGEETDVIKRILDSGAIGYWVPNARVEHCISRERQTVAYIFRHCVAAGETKAFLVGTNQAATLWFGAPRWLWRRLISEWVRYRVHRLISPAAVWVKHLRDCGQARGAIRYWRGLNG